MENNIDISDFDVEHFDEEVADFTGLSNLDFGIQATIRYSRKAALKTFNGRLNGAFQNSFTSACSFGSYNGSIDANSVKSIVSAGFCSTGHEIMKVTHV